MNITGTNTGKYVADSYTEANSGAEYLGSKGDVIEGVVRKVSDKVSIDFNGKELNVSKSAVQNAKEGDKVKFQIMDVSNKGIVLKTMGSSGEVNGEAMGVTFTELETDSAIGGILEQESTDNETEQTTYETTENVTEEDIESAINDNGILSDLDEYTLEAFERLLESIKAKRELEVSQIVELKAKLDSLREAIESATIKNRIPKGASSAIAEYFIKYDIPVTEEKLEQLGIAFTQLEKINDVNDSMIEYILKNELPVTIENLYNSMYTGNVGTGVNNNVNKDGIYASVRSQIEGIVTQSGYEWDMKMQERTKWLFEHDIPINEEMLNRQDELLTIQETGLDNVDILKSVSRGMKEGYDPANVPLFDAQYDMLETAVNDFKTVTDDALKNVIANGEIINLNNLKEAKVQKRTVSAKVNVDIVYIKAKRNLEEIRLGMTIDAARKLSVKGIDINTAELEKVVEGLRQLENDYYAKLLNNEGIGTDNDEISIISETERCRSNLAGAPAHILAQIAESRMGNLLSEYSEIDVSISHVNAVGEYEKLMTAPRADMGDSIQKAFANVDSLIESVGLEVTQENQRIVRILAHNQMEITTENIQNLKTYDAKMQYLLTNLKPETTLELIRNGNNPLEMSLDMLNQCVAQINENMSDTKRDNGESGYGRFLWKLEKENKITDDERKSYIGIYRLLNQVSKRDTAAIGAVINAGQELNLKNLMTAVRSRKNSGMNEVIDDNFGMAEIDNRPETINDQINSAFEYNYEMHTVSVLKDEITPSKLYEVADGNLDNIMDMPLEELMDKINEQEENASVNKAYCEELAEEFRKAATDKESIAYLKSFGLEPTLFSINAARQVLTNGQTVLKDILKMDSDSEETARLEEEIESFVDALQDDETAENQAQKVREAARQILVNTEQGALDAEMLTKLKIMESGIRFNGLLSRRRCYEIPVVTEEGITNINLTLVNGHNEKGKVSIRMSTETRGNISCEFTIKNDKVQGLILAENSNEIGSGLLSAIEGDIEKCGFTLVSLNSATHNVTGAYVPESIEADNNNTVGMYRLAKAVITTLTRKDV